MKLWIQWIACALCAAAAAGAAAQGQTEAAQSDAAAAKEPPIQNSALNAVLFYQLLLGELNVQGGEPAAGFSIVLVADS